MLASLFYSLAFLYLMYEAVRYFGYNSFEYHAALINFNKEQSEISKSIKEGTRPKSDFLNFVKENKTKYRTIFLELTYFIFLFIGVIASPHRWIFIAFLVYTFIYQKLSRKIFDKGKKNLFRFCSTIDFIVTVLALSEILYLHDKIILPFL